MSGMVEENQRARELARRAAELGLKITLAAPDANFERFYYRRLKIDTGDAVLIVPFDDEYGDGEDGAMLSAFNLALLEARDYEAAEDFLVWAKDLGLDASDPVVREIWLQLRENAPRLLALLPDVILASHSDYEFGMGFAQAMRAHQLDRSDPDDERGPDNGQSG